MTKKTFSPPPIIYIALFFVLLGSAYWWFLRNPNQSLSDNGKITWLPNPINNSISSGERILRNEK
jgi:hypothetical protein